MRLLFCGESVGSSEKLARCCAIAIGFFVPISVAMDNLLLALLLVFWLASGKFREKLAVIRDNPVALAAIFLFAMLVFGSFYGNASSNDALGALGKYIDLLFVPVFITLFAEQKTRTQALYAFLASMLLTLLLSYLLAFGILQQNSLLRGPASNAFVFKLHITQNFFMAFSAFILAVWSYFEQNRHRKILFAILALVSLYNVIFMVQGRIGFIVFAVLLVYLFAQKFGYKGLLAGMLASVLLGAAAFQFSPAFHQRMETTINEYSSWRPDKATAITNSVGQRLEFYDNTLSIIKEHPVWGVGTGGFEQAYAKKVSGTGMEATHNPHNEFLLIMSQIGIAGILLLINLFYREFSEAAKMPPGRKILATGLALSMITGCLFNSFMLDHAEGLFFAWMSALFFAGNDRFSETAFFAQGR